MGSIDQALSPGKRFWQALEHSTPLQVVGTINAYCALLAERAGFNAIYLSGAGVANACYGAPDLGITTLDDVATEVKRITGASALPLLVDADTGWGDPALTVTTLTRAGAAGVHLEDQVDRKRCGHRPGKQLVTTEEMVVRLNAAKTGRIDRDFVIMARTDAYTVEGLDSAINRAQRYIDAGADMIFAEAIASLEDYHRFTSAIRAPILANITEFGKTPLFTRDELHRVGIKMILYPLSAFRAMNAAAIGVYATLRRDGSQKALLDKMQTRAELYEVLDYENQEKRLDALLKQTQDA